MTWYRTFQTLFAAQAFYASLLRALLEAFVQSYAHLISFPLSAIHLYFSFCQPLFRLS